MFQQQEQQPNDVQTASAFAASGRSSAPQAASGACRKWPTVGAPSSGLPAEPPSSAALRSEGKGASVASAPAAAASATESASYSGGNGPSDRLQVLRGFKLSPILEIWQARTRNGAVVKVRVALDLPSIDGSLAHIPAPCQCSDVCVKGLGFRAPLFFYTWSLY